MSFCTICTNKPEARAAKKHCHKFKRQRACHISRNKHTCKKYLTSAGQRERTDDIKIPTKESSPILEANRERNESAKPYFLYTL